MSYSRWTTSIWYTFWAAQDVSNEDRNTAIFAICSVASFPAIEIRADIEACVDRAVADQCFGGGPRVSYEEREELRGCMRQFLADVDEMYPEPLT